ncbi:helix-turn-helix transcriptional regulator [Pseudonocardia kunmingensis]|uniref:helix-turn-helix transcriptional regulator n=1 Tax=Pseudonocardia kunmingensis TaxID=630975 RepID=UPI001152D29C|nr:YafY family protein [Pseudonocardia kunmingensis]
MTTPARLLRLLSLLQTRREWSGAELAERLGVTDRTVRRDVGRLRELGYPIAGTTGTAGGYRLTSGRDLPPLLLDDEEAIAVATGLLTATGTEGVEETAVRALAKLSQVLPDRLRHRLAAVGETTVRFPARRGTRVDPAVLGLLGGAARDREVVRFGYRRRDGAVADRRVEPYQLLAGYGLWWLLAYDLHRDDWRTFRVDRVTAPQPVRHRFAPRPLPAEDTVTYLRESIGRALARHTVRAVVRAPAEVVAARLPMAVPGRVQAIDGERCRVHLSSDSLDRVVQDVVALGPELEELDAPPEVREHLREVGRRLLGV